MGRSRIEITTTGNHGCDRKAKPGEALQPLCESKDCIDCQARRFVQQLHERGASVEIAQLIHWPDDVAITDDLAEGVRRSGAF